MKIGTGAKVTIGIIGIIAAGIIGFLISTYQLEAAKARKRQMAAKAEQGGANAPGKALDASAVQHSDERVVADKDEEEGRNAMMETLDEVTETPDTKTITRQSGTPQAISSRTENSETSQDQPKMEYHESYNTFISVIRKAKETKEERDSIKKEMDRLVAEWKRSVRDPENPIEEERAELGEEVTPLRAEHAELNSDLNSLADELIDEIEAVAPGAIQTESEDTGRGILNTVSIDYEQIQSELGSPPEEDDADLADFFAGFEIKSHPSSGWSSVNIK